MRIPIDKYFLDMAVHVSTRATCARMEVGAILVNERMHVDLRR